MPFFGCSHVDIELQYATHIILASTKETTTAWVQITSNSESKVLLDGQNYRRSFTKEGKDPWIFFCSGYIETTIIAPQVLAAHYKTECGKLP